MPDVALDGVPEPWRTFLAGLQQRLDAWASAIGMPDEFAGLSGLEMARELAVVLRYGFRDRSQRSAYLRRLREAGVLPLRLTAEEANAACGAMSAAGLASGPGAAGAFGAGAWLMSLTGGFDIVLEIADTSLTETCAGLHARVGSPTGSSTPTAASSSTWCSTHPC